MGGFANSHPVDSFLSKKFKINHIRAKIIAEQLVAKSILSALNMSGNWKVL